MLTGHKGHNMSDPPEGHVDHPKINPFPEGICLLFHIALTYPDDLLHV